MHVFNLGDWSLDKIIALGRNVERIDLDVRNRILYGGTQAGGNPYLVQYDLLATAERAMKIGDDARVVGIAVDRATSFVYVNGPSAQHQPEQHRQECALDP